MGVFQKEIGFRQGLVRLYRHTAINAVFSKYRF
jgi:hypothetical protein